MTRNSKNFTFFVSSECELQPWFPKMHDICISFQSTSTCPDNSNAQTTFVSFCNANHRSYDHDDTVHFVITEFLCWTCIDVSCTIWWNIHFILYIWSNLYTTQKFSFVIISITKPQDTFFPLIRWWKFHLEARAQVTNDRHETLAILATTVICWFSLTLLVLKDAENIKRHVPLVLKLW